MAFDADLEKPATFDPDAEADGVTYAVMTAAPELRFFHCEPYRATAMSTKTCSARWIKAQAAYGDLGAALAACVSCSIGAAHSGRGVVRYSRWHKSPFCARCGTGGVRLVGNRRCISDYNREREMRIGRNARGNRPVELLAKPLRRVEILVEVDGVAERFVDPTTSGLTETMIQFLRTNTGEIAFGWAGGGMAPLEVDPYEPADDGVADAADVSEGDPGAEGWHLTDHRCHACRGAMLQSVASPDTYRCADCGGHRHHGHGQDNGLDPAGGGSASDLDLHRRKVDRHRALLFGTSAFVRGRWR